MPSQRKQTVISSKGLMTIPEPYRSYMNLKEGDTIIVKWDKFVIVIPENIFLGMSAFENDLMDALLSKMGPEALFLMLWERITPHLKGQVLNALKLQVIEE